MPRLYDGQSTRDPLHVHHAPGLFFYRHWCCCHVHPVWAFQSTTRETLWFENNFWFSCLSLLQWPQTRPYFSIKFLVVFLTAKTSAPLTSTIFSLVIFLTCSSCDFGIGLIDIGQMFFTKIVERIAPKTEVSKPQRNCSNFTFSCCLVNSFIVFSQSHTSCS